MDNENNVLKAENERLKLIISLLADKLRIINNFIAKDIIIDREGNIQITSGNNLEICKIGKESSNAKHIIVEKENNASNATFNIGGNEINTTNAKLSIGGRQNNNSNAILNNGGKQNDSSNAIFIIGENKFNISNTKSYNGENETDNTNVKQENDENIPYYNKNNTTETTNFNTIAAFCLQKGVHTLLEAVQQNKILSSEFNFNRLKLEIKKSMKKSDTHSLRHTGKIILGLYDNPHRHYNELSKLTGLTKSGLYKQIRLLKNKGIIIRTKFQVYNLTPFTFNALVNSIYL